MQEAGRLLRLALLVLVVLTVVFVTNQTAQVVSLAERISPAFARLVLYALLIFYTLVAAIPAYLILRLPPLLAPPDASAPDYNAFLVKLGERLKRNAHLRGVEVVPGDRESIEAALARLDALASARIKEIAKGVFIATSVSQYGRLDAMIVFSALVRIIWEVAHIYNQRPRLREMGTLYINVAGTAIAASEMENLIVLENQLEPVFASLLGTSLAPGANAVTSLLVNSAVQGSANAFLVLRVGIIAKGYSASLTRPERGVIRRSAVIQAAGLLSSVVGESMAKVTGAVMRAAGRSTGRIAVAGGRFMVNRSLGTWRAVRRATGATANTFEAIAARISRFFTGNGRND